MFEYNPNLLKAVLLLTLAVSGNFIGNTLSCKTQFHMTNNMYVKHLILIFIIYFTLSYASENINNPLIYMKNALLIWFCYLLFTKQNIIFTGISASLLFGTYIIDSFISYYKEQAEGETNVENKTKLEDKINISNKLRNISFYSGIIAIIVGFLLYMKDKYVEYGNEFNPLTFLFGKVSCNSLK